jgi:hypothetical protein
MTTGSYWIDISGGFLDRVRMLHFLKLWLAIRCDSIIHDIGLPWNFHGL